MAIFSVKHILEVTECRLHSGEPSMQIEGVQSDSRKVTRGDLFVALKGERVDGHEYVKEAFLRGAVCALVERTTDEMVSDDKRCIVVTPNSVKALGEMAYWYRNRFSPRVIGVTGSIGKTTTKDLIQSVLSVEYNTLANEGNLNTEIGVPLTLFRLRDIHEVAVIEMGMRGAGQIAYLAGLARPHIGVLTNITESHLEVLGSVENIAKAKAELLESLPPDGVAVLNQDNKWVVRMSEKFGGHKVWYSASEPADVYAEHIQSLGDKGMRFELVAAGQRCEINLALAGYHNVSNALAAVATGIAMGLELSDVRAGLLAARASRMRTEVLEIGGFTLINDTYNASPASNRAALAVQNDLAGDRRKIAVLGNMLELGTYSRLGHVEVGEMVARQGVDVLITVGELAGIIASTAREHGRTRVIEAANNNEAAKILLGLVRPLDVVLIKGSRSVSMENIVMAIKARFGAEEPDDASH